MFTAASPICFSMPARYSSRFSYAPSNVEPANLAFICAASMVPPARWRRRSCFPNACATSSERPSCHAASMSPGFKCVAMAARSMGSSFSPAGRRSCSIKARCEAKRSSSPMPRTRSFISSSPVANGRTVFRPAWNSAIETQPFWSASNSSKSARSTSASTPSSPPQARCHLSTVRSPELSLSERANAAAGFCAEESLRGKTF